MSGSASERFVVVTASARSVPALMYPIEAGVDSNVTCTCPPIRLVSEGPAPRYGTCTMSTPAMAVVAAGIWSKPPAAELGDHIPLETERGYHLMIRDPAIVPRIPTADAERKFVATSMELGLRLAGTVELAGLDAPPNWKRARILLTHARRMFPALRDEVPDQNIT